MSAILEKSVRSTKRSVRILFSYHFCAILINVEDKTIAENKNEALSNISYWFDVNKLSLNMLKPKFIQYHHKQQIMNENDYLKLRIKDSEIERVQ